MSKGLSKSQNVIVGLLRGTERGQVYGNCRGGLTTAEILAELSERGLVDGAMPRKLSMFTVRRACASLLNRGLVSGTYCPDDRGYDTISWKATPQE